MYRVLSLFDGLSAGQVALNRARIPYSHYYSSEINQDAIGVTQQNFPNTIQLGDIRQIKNPPLCDLMMGGFCCQSFSRAGQMGGFEDERGFLFFDLVRILNKVKPPYFLFENVVMKKEYEDVISGELGVKPTMISSSLLSPQLRSRLYWTNIPFKIPPDKGIILKDILLESPHKTFPINSPQFLPTYIKWGNHIQNRAYYKEGKIACLTESGTRKLNIYEGDSRKPPHLFRRIVPIEAERCQGIPDNYTREKEGGVVLSNKKRFGLVGNSFTVDVISHILKGLTVSVGDGLITEGSHIP